MVVAMPLSHHRVPEFVAMPDDDLNNFPLVLRESSSNVVVPSPAVVGYQEERQKSSQSEISRKEFWLLITTLSPLGGFQILINMNFFSNTQIQLTCLIHFMIIYFIFCLC